MTPYIGEIRLFSGTYVPQNWVACNGQLLSISEYETLFMLLGTTYGGDGQETFGVPNLSGRVAVGVGQGPGLSYYQPGELGGAESVALQAPHLPPHTHTASASLRVSAAAGTTASPNGNLPANSGQPAYAAQAGSGTMAAGAVQANTTPAGSSQPHENRQPSLAITYIIATTGIFPSPS